ncbi:MAG TPA: decaprenyl-phosphate phosphoribosyltransferase [Anaerohalosphaeraceae bacterium]|jgi:4-hydroxybenzoate polyprenyltransferase|nr:decaprenyl-phosphate phosphoribosyltransferase [Anaerohalosphaeraceae bacterium]HRT49891.1 decaprenyl-phosphate phosphoribosyltransferase [Anaerohalosphaeraceae bacterium]HRT86783.1 decaprenyl-phosphate phosphoribosyltransferase [Anaerohalosphaeraceae bacterium]
MAIGDLVQLARPRHWVKNVVVLLPVVFGMRMADASAWAWAGTAAVAFCLAASFSYIVNDLRDCESDRSHPYKKNRPLVSGRVPPRVAAVEAGVFLTLSIGVACVVSPLVTAILAAYIVLQMCYTWLLKDKVLLDVICIAIGFVLRASAGAVAIRVAISPWLFICMFTICLFMGFCKRYNELVTIGDRADAGNHRQTLMTYTPDLLTHLITLSAGIAVVAFLFYGLTESTVRQFGTHYFVYTLPLVVYAVFRFAMLSMKGCYADPTDLILRDRPFQITAALWMASAVGIIVWGPRVAGWMDRLY